MPPATPPPSPQPSRPERRPGLFRRLFSQGARGHAWDFLNWLDARPALKKGLLIGVPALAIFTAAGVWGYQYWARDNSISIGRQWLDAGKLDRAAAAARDALALRPDDPAAWRLASDVAWRGGDRTSSLTYAQKAAEVGRYREADVLVWAGGALLAGDVAQARKASTFLKPGEAENSPAAQRFLGELERRDGRFAEARGHFENALRLDARDKVTSLAIDEIPFGIACLQSGDEADRAKGRLLLAKWTDDVNWGATALRELIKDAMIRGDRAAAGRWATALRIHPRCTLGDIPTCLGALWFSDDSATYAVALAALEKGREKKPLAAAEFMGWLNKIGRGEDALAWLATLDPSILRDPAVAQARAEALRSTGQWKKLLAAVNQADWGPSLDFLRWAYGMVAARQLGDGAVADSFWKSLRADGERSGAHAFAAGQLLYLWDCPREGTDLLWLAANQGDFAYQALGALVRLYQMAGDDAGQFRAFEKLSAIRPDDRGITNNYVYFAALTGLGDTGRIGKMARDLFEQEPDNITYRCTYAFVLVRQGDASQALRVIGSEASTWKTSPMVAFAYGAALAGVGRKAEAKDVFASIDPRTQDPVEKAWIQQVLR